MIERSAQSISDLSQISIPSTWNKVLIGAGELNVNVNECARIMGIVLLLAATAEGCILITQMSTLATIDLINCDLLML
jgi:hypothetical protein